MAISVNQIDLNVLNMHTRFPFKYGIASLEALPHLFVRATVKVNGKTEMGVAADGLPPKWFTKNPEAPFTTDLDEMIAVIKKACDLAKNIQGETVFDFWQKVYRAQEIWAKTTAYPPLLWAFGVSLVERAVIDAFCRANGESFAHVVRNNTLGLRLGEIHAELNGLSASELLPQSASRSIVVRHTVGLADPLTDGDIAEADRVHDGLPQSLEANIATYGLTHLKIKLCGDIARDLARLEKIDALIERQPDFAFTLDGNEQYVEVGPFRQLWDAIMKDDALSTFMDHLIFVEQPFRRDVALGVEVQTALKNWTDRPPMIIDESDGALNSSVQALACGYVGTSHKNCKGVFKGIANACLMAYRKRQDDMGSYILSGEDLANVGPVALLQDLAVLATLGVTHSERNGHHYFAGLGMYSESVQAQVLMHHGLLYHKHKNGFPVLNVQHGQVDVSCEVDAPFGYGFDLDTTQFTPLDDWSAETLKIK